MTAALPRLFKGIAVVIDNGIGKGDPIDKILDHIKKGGGHAIQYQALPEVGYDLEHFSRVSFFIMDWNLRDLSEHLDEGVASGLGLRLTAALDAEMVAQNVDFLKRLSRNRHAPVFIFTNEDPQTVLDVLNSDDALRRNVDESHILVKRKADVENGLYEVLEKWAEETPSVLTLKTWERAYVKAANELFIDLHDKTSYWPVLLWQTFGEDGIPPALEMNRLLNRLVESRMGPLDLDLGPFLPLAEDQRNKDAEAYRASMYQVLEGERFLRDERLDANVFAPGDVFRSQPTQGNATTWINIRAECDCLHGSDSTELYLLQAKTLDNVQINKEFGAITDEKDNEAIVFAMLQGQTYSIKLKDIRIKSIKAIRRDYTRLGRLLPPFITRVQQRYAAYVQRPGMPRIPSALRGDLPGEPQPVESGPVPV